MALPVTGRMERVRQARRDLQPMGSGPEFDDDEVARRLRRLGPAGGVARQVDLAAEALLADVESLSDLTAPLAVAYLERITRPLAALDIERGARLTTRGYLAQVVVERRGGDFGVDTVPVLGDVVIGRKGRPPQDLLSRVVKATRRNFAAVRALPAPVWDGLVVCVTGRTHAERGSDDGGERLPPLDSAVVDALLRFGWVLRQVDLAYGLSPEELPTGGELS